jgi:uncharacterized membrane protein YfcA
MIEEFWLFIVLALLAEIVGTVSGFGSSILFVPIAAMFFDFKIVLGITAVFHVFSNISKIILFRKGIDKQIVLKLGLPAILFVIIGALLTTLLPGDTIELYMAVLLIALALFLIYNQQFKLKQTDKNLYLGGVFSGFLAGLIGTGGAIRGLTLIAFNLEKNIFIATSALIDLGVDFSRAVIYVANGYFLVEHLVLIPFLIGISVLGTWIGKLILGHTSEKFFKYFVLVIIISTSIYQLISILWDSK